MYAVLIYGFPVILMAFEWGLRVLLTVDTSGFIGPTLAAAALTIMVPLIRPKVLDVEAPTDRAFVTSKGDSNFIACVWLFFLAGLFAWSATCYLSQVHPDWRLLWFPAHMTIGGCAYVVGLLLVFMKGRF